jgi:hypothetical protein
LPDTVGAHVIFVRGFADAVRLELPFERQLLDRLVALCPLLRTLVFVEPRDEWRWQYRHAWELASPDTLRKFTGLQMGGFQINDTGTKALAALDLPKLERLTMRSMQMLPAAWQHLADRDWVELDLHHNSLGTRGVRFLLDHDRARLRSLDVGSNEIMNAGLQLLAQTKLPALQRLSLRRSKLAPNGMHLLGHLPSLVSLDLSCNEVGDAFDFVLPNLRELSLRETKLRDSGLQSLARSSFAHELVTLDLASNSSLSDPEPLHAFTALRSLNISGTGLAKQAKALKDALPNVRVFARSKQV